MKTRPKGELEQQLFTVFNLGAIGDLTDGQLLERFATRGGEAGELAFAALVERHGAMVLRVCRHALSEPHDADDAFQATFLILVKQARSLWVQDSLGPWLHRVAQRTATKARIIAARVRQRERSAAAVRPSLFEEKRDWEESEIVAQLHIEIDRLPERYRMPVVLCDLQGLTHEKAARHLGWPVGTLKTRLARARELLKGRLLSRGATLPASLFAGDKRLGLVLPLGARGAALPSALLEATVRAAGPLVAGGTVSTSMISSRVAILIEEAMKTMVVSKLKLVSAAVLAGSLGAAAAGVLAQQGSRDNGVRTASEQQRLAEPQGARRDGAQAGQPSTPAYITQSRALILTRLEEEVAEARARLDRTLKRFQSADHPAVIRAQDTLEALSQRLDRIDRVLVDVVETYPTMVDFSGGPAGATRGEGIGWDDAGRTQDVYEKGKDFFRNEASEKQNPYSSQFSQNAQQQGNSQNNAPKAGHQSQGNKSNDAQNNAEQPRANRRGLFDRVNSKAGQGGTNESGKQDNGNGKSQSGVSQNRGGGQGNKNAGESTGSRNKAGQQGEKSNGQSAGGEKGAALGSQPQDPGVRGHGSGRVLADLDDDGIVDLYVTNGGSVQTGGKNQSNGQDSGAKDDQGKHPAENGSQSKQDDTDTGQGRRGGGEKADRKAGSEEVRGTE